MGYLYRGKTDAPPPEDSPPVLLVMALVVVTAGLCVGWLLVMMW